MQIKSLPYSSGHSPSLLQRTGALVATVALTGAALMFSAVFLALALSIGTAAFAYLWWKTRHLRKQMKNLQPRSTIMEAEVFEGEIIEGEAVRVDDARHGLR